MAYFGDLRINRRFTQLKSVMVSRCCVILRQLATTRTEEIGYGRFLRHPKVTAQKIFASAYDHASLSCSNRHVLLVQDTSTLGFGLNPKAGSLGPIGDNRGSRGFYAHPVVCLDSEQGTCLGLSSAQLYNRIEHNSEDPLSEVKERKRVRRSVPFADKESFRWWSNIEASVKRTQTATKHTVVADSESDIYDLMTRLVDENIDFVLRSYHNRTLNRRRSGYTLFTHLANEKVKQTYQVNLPATDKRSAHLADLEVKWCPVKFSRPHDHKNKELPLTLDVNIIEITEKSSSVVGKEKPIHWRLITSHPIENFEQVLQIIKWYTWRWVIEQMFRTIKLKGIDIQSALVESEHALKNLTALSFISAVRIMQLVQARDGENDLVIKQVFTPKEEKVLKKLNPKLEGTTEKLKNPHKKNSLAYASWIIARLGGWSGYKSQRPPGPITMANGLKRFGEAMFFSDLSP